MYVLGVHTKHDASACLIKDNKLIAFVEEERFSRVKHHFGFPYKAVDYCLKTAGITLNEVDKIAISNLPPRDSFLMFLKYFYLQGLFLRESIKSWPSYLLFNIQNSLIEKNGFKYFKDNGFKEEQVHYIEHHLSHAASAYRASPFTKSAVITVDGWGDYSTALLGSATGNATDAIKVHKRFTGINSLGLLYASFTGYLGYPYGKGHESKVMGMAAYGTPSKDFSEILSYEKGNFKVNPAYVFNATNSIKQIEKKFGPRLEDPFKELKKHYIDIAATLQKELENAMCKLLEEAVEVSNSRNLSIAGGVALNCKMNGTLFASGLIDNIFIQPAAGDNGKSLGAALEALALEGKKGRIEFDHAYWGPEFSNEEIEKALKEKKAKYEFHDDISGIAAELIAKGKVVGWFQGRMEVGPRALGNRSILADPTSKEMLKHVNIIKGREYWRPLAASFLRESMLEYFGYDVAAPFMILAFYALPEKRKEIPAVIHADNSSRPQSVSKKQNERYYKLIKEFEKIKGVPAVLNTSFNAKEPIVCTPKDAINTFYNTGMDYLAIGNYLVKK